MAAIMVVTMDIIDDAWMATYFAEVPRLLDEYGARQVAGTRDVHRLEGVGKVPDRVAIFEFPSLEAIDAFFADDRYRALRQVREDSTRSEILFFDNAVQGNGAFI